MDSEATIPSDRPGKTAEVHIDRNLDARHRPAIPLDGDLHSVQQRLSLLMELPNQFAAAQRLDDLFPLIMKKVVELFPSAGRGALLVKDPQLNKLVLKAHVPEGEAALSRTLVKRAVYEFSGFIWSRKENQDGEVSQSIVAHEIDSGMYAPLVWKDEPLGVICVDNHQTGRPFTEQDLRFLIAVSRYAGAAVANHQLTRELEHKSTVLERLLTNFSPKLRSKLVEKAQDGRLVPGGEKSKVTILFSDIRGFTRISASMDAEEVVTMLNAYLPSLVKPVFDHDGTVDKFVGDAILAVFGSPEKDPGHNEKAVRCAWEMQEAIRRLNVERQAKGLVICEIGIGLHCGEVLHGFIGTEDRLEFTVIGDPVNRASRICDGAGAGEVLMTEEVYREVDKVVEAKSSIIPTKHEGDLKTWRVLRLR